MFAIEYGIGELPYPVAQNHQAGLLAQHQIQLYVAVSEHEVIYILVALHILLGKAYQEFLVFAHIRLLLAIGTLQAAVLCPVQSQRQSPAWMYGIQQPLAGTVVEHRLQELELLVRVTQAVTMGKEEHLVVNFHGLWFMVNDQSALFFQVAVCP